MNQMVFREDNALISQVLWSRLRALMNEAGATLKRTAFSFPTRESNDFATVLMDVHGDSIAQSIQSIPSFLATLPLTTQSMLARRPAAEWVEGDVMLTNDPWLGAGHLPDVSIVQPLFWRGRLTGFVGSITHVSDIGGTLFGGYTRELFEEGLRFPSLAAVGTHQARLAALKGTGPTSTCDPNESERLVADVAVWAIRFPFRILGSRVLCPGAVI